MMNPATITRVQAMQTSTDTDRPAVQVTVHTAGGAEGIGNASEAYSTSDYRPRYLYDHAEQYKGFGVTTAVGIVNTVVAPALIGLDAANQGEVDGAIKHALGEAGIESYVNVSAPASIAALKAGAAAEGIALYTHIGGQSAFTLPVAGYTAASGSARYSDGGLGEGRPVFNLVSYGFPTFADAHYGLWEVANTYEKMLAKETGLLVHRGFSLAVPRGRMESDRTLLDIMARSIETCGYTGKLGIHIDAGANEFYDPHTRTYRGLFDDTEKTREDMIALYKELVDTYPIAILQDPLEQHDRQGFTELTATTGIQIVGGDLVGTDVARIKECVAAGCVNTVMIPVCGFATFSDVVNVVRFVKGHGCEVMFENLCGEGIDVADYSVGFRAGTVYEGGLDAVANGLLSAEAAIGPRARFYGERGLKGSRFHLSNSK